MDRIEPLAGQRQSGETTRAVQAANDYLRLGRGRTLPLLLEQYCTEMSQNVPPTTVLRTLKHWSSRYDWAARAEAYDAELEAQKTARAQEIMATGLALEHERVEELKDLYALLKAQLYEQGEDGVLHNLWLPDVKQIGAGEYAERVDIERYNSPLVNDMRGVLDDLAKETGGRKQRLSHEGTGENNAIELTITDWHAVAERNRQEWEQIGNDE